ncbi:hypothetical protein Moror_10057 [Moniliophthora roreri MCA 2997]|uniref:BTB domain-containing protein n=1 Tax=Moniliophthora roreri (strain MCA 2997) TaxID=1381753 RepID=V2Y1N1_MONRO|nr:hypothetical protein Moror_10057 [Moniliophthora roreri MCA 2997]
MIFADVIVQGSDGITFGSHLKNLEVFNSAFPETTLGETDTLPSVKMQESDIISLLLQFSHNASLPDLRRSDLAVALSFLGAAETYQNRIAMQLCNEALGDLARQSSRNALRVMKYRALRNDLDGIEWLVDRAMALPLAEAVFFLQDAPEVYFVFASTQYREARKAYWENYHRAVNKIFAENVKLQKTHAGMKELVVRARQFDSHLNHGVLPSVEGVVDDVEGMHQGFKVYRDRALSKWQPYVDWVKVAKKYPVWKDFSSAGIRSPLRR